ncbi:RND superfamily putative drug exporter [Paenibacillus endophyticus]|uniref:RND superfamily putative drug exporter n=1 Tax=Paenibacillus endophyticus TaxID=1294268 RepID=A0A7W5GBI0_9BACL|nr:MMPL family transporter [Paenibacillus endophyticus]MBB3153413.1 RND superfamily putative drug exporter [Paenibacillus endophyticus]
MGIVRFALFSFHFPKTMLLFWSVLLIIAGSFAVKLDEVVQDHGLYPESGAYAQVEQALAKDFNQAAAPVILVFEKEDKIAAARFNWFIEQTLHRLARVDGLQAMVSPLEHREMAKGNYAYAILDFSKPANRMPDVLRQLDDRLPSYEGISVKATGKAVVQADVNEASHRDLARAEAVGIPLAFAVLWFLFRKTATALLPIVIGVSAVIVAMGIMYGIGTKLYLSNFVLNVIPMVGLALSIDFALMLISRFRKELLEGIIPAEALAKTMRTAGRAVLVSAACVFLGLLSFIWIPLPMFSSIAVGAMTVVAISLLAAFTLLPALLALSPPLLLARGQSRSKANTILAGEQSRSKANSILAGGQSRSKANGYAGFADMLSRFVMRRPAITCLFAGSILLIGLYPLGTMRVAIPDEGSLPRTSDSRAAAETYKTAFEGSPASNIFVLVEGKRLFLQLSDWNAASGIVNQLQKDHAVIKVESIFSRTGLSPEQLFEKVGNPLQSRKYGALLEPFLNGDRMLLHVALAEDSSMEEAVRWVKKWERRDWISTLAFKVGGEAKYQQEVFDRVLGSLGYVLGFILVSNFIVLLIAFRSVLVAVKTILLNLLSMGAAFGMLSIMFSRGVFGIEPSSIAIMIPVFIFGLVFGISMDYGVFLVSRIREEYERTGNNEQAVRIGLSSVSGVIASAAAIMIAVTLPFALGEVAGVKQLGIGIATAIFIDATIVRLLLVPSLMVMLGRWNWWIPGWLRR